LVFEGGDKRDGEGVHSPILSYKKRSPERSESGVNKRRPRVGGDREVEGGGFDFAGGQKFLGDSYSFLD